MLISRGEPAHHTALETPDTFRRLVDGIEDFAIYMLDGGGRVATWNPGAQRLKGYRPEEIIGRPYATFFPPEAVAAGRPARLLAIAAREGRAEDEGWRVRKDGSRFWADVVMAPVRDAHGALLGFAKVTRDLTRRRRDEESLAQANAELEKFSYSVSHDLRAPLRAISGYAELLLREQAGRLDEEGLRHLRVISDSAAQGGELIDAL